MRGELLERLMRVADVRGVPDVDEFRLEGTCPVGGRLAPRMLHNRLQGEVDGLELLGICNGPMVGVEVEQGAQGTWRHQKETTRAWGAARALA